MTQMANLDWFELAKDASNYKKFDSKSIRAGHQTRSNFFFMVSQEVGMPL